MKVNFFDVAPYEMPRLSRELEDPEKGLKITVEMKALDETETHFAGDLGDRLTTQYIGDPETGIRPKEAFPVIRGKRVTLSRRLMYSVAQIAVQQTAQGDDAYTPEQLIVAAFVSKPLYRGMIELARDVQKLAEPAGKDAKNDSEADTAV
ncbi:hypothetical protein [Fimbriimonas ginsengisoli]|uniref:Uncharacterized protein n=1 Tax=Fimbriimonas ginsengisoli Gsoil 348 TaxID=661478 RepID=A0A068NLA4_FIMGI|nr:hypothetical protein [Fimbriimonas ginsengisoli]AIE83535.1 hypothetical protein OP10G_0167 [Fimbriimonas ginsengisoli Gsoil 348]